MSNTTTTSHCMTTRLCVYGPIAAPESIDKLMPHEIPPFVSSPPWRSSFYILYSCFSVILLCSWTVLHLNLPATTDTTSRKFLRRVKWSFFAMFIPEYRALTAMYEWELARKSVNDMHKLLGAKKWSITHAFFANAGGFVLEYDSENDENLVLPSNSHELESLSSPNSDSEDPMSLRYTKQRLPLTAEGIKILCGDNPQLSDMFLENEGNIENEIEDQIKDKSKQDEFSKFIAVVQTLRFIINFFSRIKSPQQLTITPLELGTIILVFYSFFTVCFHWNKPQGVNKPIIIKGQLPIGNTKLIADLKESYEPYINQTEINLHKITRIPYGYFTKSQLTYSHETRISFVCYFVIGFINGAMSGVMFLLPLDGLWRDIWSYVAKITPCFFLYTTLGMSLKETFSSVEWLRKLFSTTAFISLVAYGVCRFIFFFIGFATLFYGNLPLSSYKVISWTDFVPGFIS